MKYFDRGGLLLQKKTTDSIKAHMKTLENNKP